MSTIFYSWQSDLPNATNRGLIQAALEEAAKKIRADDSIAVDPVVDRDTSGLPGAPDIAHAIFAKIDRALAFVADVSLVDTNVGGRRTPNPNVLIELGYAVKTLGWERIVLVMNTAYGEVADLPFDLRQKRVLPYSLADGDADKAGVRRPLAAQFEGAIRLLLNHLPPPPPAHTTPSAADQLIAAVESQSPNRSILARNYVRGFLKEIDRLAPTLPDTDDLDELFMEVLPATVPLMVDLARISDIVSLIDDTATAKILFKELTEIAKKYTFTGSGSYRNEDFDFYHYVGHESVAVLASPFVRDRKWEQVVSVFQESFLLPDKSITTFGYLSYFVRLFPYRNKRIHANRISLHADVLKDRYSQPPLSELISFEQFVETDFFLRVLDAALHPKATGADAWRPWSSIFGGGRTPGFIQELASKRKADALIRALSIDDATTLRNLLLEQNKFVARMWSSSGGFLHDEILTYWDPDSMCALP